MSERSKELCEQLNAEPLLHMSLHSKELFHSNVIAWFCETYPDEACDVLSQWVPSRETLTHRVQREKQNLDLSIEIPGLAPVIVENKVFAPPDESQLERYSAKSLGQQELHDPTFILLSLGDPNWQGSTFTSSSGVQWRHVSYRDLAQALTKGIQGIDGFPGDVLRHYVSFILLLSTLVEELANPGPNDSLYLQSSTRELLQAIRLHSAIEKFRFRSIVASLQRSTSSKLVKTTVKFNVDFTPGGPLLDAFVECGNGDSVGWQYQNQQWRLAVKTKLHSGKPAELTPLRHKVVESNYLKWFNFAPIQDLIGRDVSEVPKNEAKGGFNSYAPDFTYRYRVLPHLTLAELEKLSIHYLTEAKKWV
jgi:hypothetical protein